MKLVNATVVSILALSLAACSISVSDSGIHEAEIYEGRDDYVTVTLPSGDKDSFSCPDEMHIFVVDAKDSGGGIVYGCRSDDADVPGRGE